MQWLQHSIDKYQLEVSPNHQLDLLTRPGQLDS